VGGGDGSYPRRFAQASGKDIMNTSWIIGPRTLVEGHDNKGKTITRRGKNGGPVISQSVVKVLTPKRSA
jgi:hypothetical protein